MTAKTILVMVGLTLFFLYTAVLVPSLIPSRVVLSRNACLANLKVLQQKKREWARANDKKPSATPSETDLFPNDTAQNMPICPAGGVYTIGSLGSPPQCSVSNHVVNPR